MKTHGCNHLGTCPSGLYREVVLIKGGPIRQVSLSLIIFFFYFQNLNKLEQKRQKYINSLIKCEKEFCDELKRGVDAFLSPLSGVISDNSHRTIFMSLDRVSENNQLVAF